jgi:hypothetical protein
MDMAKLAIKNVSSSCDNITSMLNLAGKNASEKMEVTTTPLVVAGLTQYM